MINKGRALAALLFGLGGLAVMSDAKASPKGSTLRINAAGLSYPIPAAGLTRAQVADWAGRLGVPVATLLIAIILGSERPGQGAQHRAEQRYIAHTLLNRAALGSEFGGPDLWGVAVTDERTGTQGQNGRQYASSRPPQGEDLVHLLGVADEAIRERAAGQTWGWITHFHHIPEGEQLVWRNGVQVRVNRRAELEVRRAAQGYFPVDLPGIDARSIVTFLGPSSAKLAALARPEGGAIA